MQKQSLEVVVWELRMSGQTGRQFTHGKHPVNIEWIHDTFNVMAEFEERC